MPDADQVNVRVDGIEKLQDERHKALLDAISISNAAVVELAKRFDVLTKQLNDNNENFVKSYASMSVLVEDHQGELHGKDTKIGLVAWKERAWGYGKASVLFFSILWIVAGWTFTLYISNLKQTILNDVHIDRTLSTNIATK